MKLLTSILVPMALCVSLASADTSFPAGAAALQAPQITLRVTSGSESADGKTSTTVPGTGVNNGSASEEVSAGKLKGELLSPTVPAKALLLIVPGSGPTTRDGNNPYLGKPAIYKLLAEDLAKYGIATVRVDKRGMFSSAAATANPNDVTMQDYALDIRAWADSLKGRSGQGCIWVLGHSEGALAALLAAQPLQGEEAGDTDGICGLILAAAPGRKTADILREQLARNPANAQLLPDALASIAALEQGKAVDVSTLPPPLHPLFNPAVQGFLVNQMKCNPTELISFVTLPVLILQGQNDIQVSDADAKLLHTANPGSKLVLLPGMTHVLKTARSGSLEDNYATYNDPEMPVSKELVQSIVDFIGSTRPGVATP